MCGILHVTAGLQPRQLRVGPPPQSNGCRHWAYPHYRTSRGVRLTLHGSGDVELVPEAGPEDVPDN